MKYVSWAMFGLALLATRGIHAAGVPQDPLDSPQWETMVGLYMKGEPIVFDERVRVHVPAEAEDSLNVPVAVDATALPDIREVLVFIDLNPIPKVLSFEPVRVRPYLAFRVKLQQASPVRAAVRTADGVWHVGGAWVDAAGGGCTVPSVGGGNDSWADSLGEVHARRWSRKDGTERLRVRIMHPMDTGLAPGIPSFFLEQIQVQDAAGGPLARLETFEPLSENPILSLDLPSGEDARGAILVTGADNNGNRIHARVAP